MSTHRMCDCGRGRETHEVLIYRERFDGTTRRTERMSCADCAETTCRTYENNDRVAVVVTKIGS